jgi:FkbM family methyltransferase
MKWRATVANDQKISPSSDYRTKSRLDVAARNLGARLAQGPLRNLLRGVYRLLQRITSRGKGIESTLPGGEVVRILPEYRYVTWNPAEYAAFRAATQNGNTVLDIGANVGCYSVLFAQWVGHHGRVYAFEPDPAVAAGLTRHIALNGVSGVCAPVASAVAEKASSGRLFLESEHGDGRLAVTGDDALSARIVSATSVDDFCRDRGLSPDVIKIDVEGAELSVLRGARDTIASGRGRLSLFMEIHPAIWPKMDCSRELLEEELTVQGLRAESLTPRDDPWSVEGECLRLRYV